MSAPTPEALWTVAEVARLLTMSPQWVYKHAELGTLPCVRLGSSLRFRPEAIRRYLEGLERRRVVPFPVNATTPIHGAK